MPALDRRYFIGGGAAALAAGRAAAATVHSSPNGKALAGIFPIGWTPCHPNNSLDLDAMAAQRRFVERGKVAGMVWPQNASGWQTLSAAEWHQGADALLSVKGRSALVLGVQTVGFDVAKSTDYARYAGRNGADAIMSLTPPGATDAEIIAYFRTLAAASNLPLMVQAVGKVSVDTLVALADAVPSLVAVKDEAEEDPVARGPGLMARTGGRLEDFAGSGGGTLFPELERGFLGSCPFAGLADVLQRCFDLYFAGDRRAAFEAFGMFLAFRAVPRSNDYVMIARGVFPEDVVTRPFPPPASGRPYPARGPVTAAEKAEISRALDYLKPYLVA